MKRKHVMRRGAVLLFVVYIFLLILVIVFKYPTGLVSSSIERWKAGQQPVRLEPQLVPFKTIIFYIKRVHATYDWFFKNLACNVIMFMPYGILIPFIVNMNQLRGIKTVVSGCLLSVFIEVLQYVTTFGQMDVDDVILNTLGVAFGYGVFLLAERFFIKHKS